MAHRKLSSKGETSTKVNVDFIPLYILVAIVASVLAACVLVCMVRRIRRRKREKEKDSSEIKKIIFDSLRDIDDNANGGICYHDGSFSSPYVLLEALSHENSLQSKRSNKQINNNKNERPEYKEDHQGVLQCHENVNKRNVMKLCVVTETYHESLGDHDEVVVLHESSSAGIINELSRDTNDSCHQPIRRSVSGVYHEPLITWALPTENGTHDSLPGTPIVEVEA